MNDKPKPGPMAPPPARFPIEWPTTRHKLQLAGYRLQYARPCKLCAAKIEFWKTPAKKLIPLDRRPDDTFMPHWATCPHAEEFRKKQASGAAQRNLFGSSNPVERRKSAEITSEARKEESVEGQGQREN